jgi:hypothetical protein
VRSLARAAGSLTDEAAICEALDVCNEVIYAEAAPYPERTTMGTTIAGLVVTEQAVVVFNVGDSRVYVLDVPATEHVERAMAGRPSSTRPPAIGVCPHVATAAAPSRRRLGRSPPPASSRRSVG